MLSESIRNRFRRLKINGERCGKSTGEKISSDLSVIEYMNCLIDSGEVCDFKDICFCLWNISDSFALLRNSGELYKNHLRFSNTVLSGSDKYKFWTVCDTSQRFTLISGGYENFWQELYKDAAENSVIAEENYRIAFEAHRAAMAVHPNLKIPQEHLQYASDKFSEFIKSSREREEIDFYRLIYLSSFIKAFKSSDIDIEKMCSLFYEYLNQSDNPSSYLCGEWKYLNRVRSRRNQAVVGITAAINSLIDVGEIQRAVMIYDTSKRYGLPENAYINKRLCNIE